MIASEVRRTTDQWNPLKIAFGRPHEADFPAALMQLLQNNGFGTQPNGFDTLKINNEIAATGTSPTWAQEPSRGM